MTGNRRGSRSSAKTHDAKESSKAAESTHLVTKGGKAHAHGVVSTVEPTHGPNMGQRMDEMDANPEVLPPTDPTVERAGVPFVRRVDEGQNRGNE